MKHLLAFLISVFLLSSVEMASAQSKTPAAHAASPASFSSSNSNLREVGAQIRAQDQTIKKDLKAGKITLDRVRLARAKITSVRRLELLFFHQNGRRELTDAQKDQLNQALSQNSNLI